MPRTRRVKSYPIFKLVKVGGKFIKLFKRVTLWDFKDHYNINKTNRVVGWTPDYVGAIKSKVVTSQNIIVDSLRKIFNSIESELSDSFLKDMAESAKQHRVVYSAGFDTSHDHIKEYFKDNSTEETWPVERILKVLNLNRFQWFRSPVISFNRAEELFTLVRVNKNSFSGHYTSKLKGVTKGESEMASRSAAIRLFETIRRQPTKNLFLWSVLGREKDIKVDYFKEVKEVGTRVVLCCETAPMILLMWFAQKISFILSVAGGHSITFNILGEYDGEKAKSIVDQESYFDYKLEADWSYYDSNIDTNFLKVAGAIMLAGLPSNLSHNNIIYYIIKSFITKYVVMTPGIVVELNRAQPSGHPFGTLVNCYVNTIYWSLIGYKIYGDDYGQYMKINVYGDDTYAYFKDHPNLKNIDNYVLDCGLKSEPLINNFRRCSAPCDDDKKIDFLKRRISLEGIKWNHKKMFDKLFYQSKNRSYQDQVLLLFSYIETCPNDKDLRLLIFSLLKVIRNDEKIMSEISDIELINRLQQTDFNLDSAIVNASRKTNYSFRKFTEFTEIEKYGAIYSYRSISRNITDEEDYFFRKIPHKLEMIITCLGFNINQINSKIESDNFFNNKSPPSVLEKKIGEIISDFYIEIQVDSILFLNRVVSRS